MKEKFDFVMYEQVAICRKTNFHVFADSREEAERIVREADKNEELEGCHGREIYMDDFKYLYDTAEPLCEDGAFDVCHYGDESKSIIHR